MSQWVLKANVNVVPRQTSMPLNTIELYIDTKKKKRETFDVLVDRIWGASINPATAPNEPKEDFEEYEDKDKDPRRITKIEDPIDSTRKLPHKQPEYEHIISLEVQLHIGEDFWTLQVKIWVLVPNVTGVGLYDDNPVLNWIVYEVELSKGQVK